MEKKIYLVKKRLVIFLVFLIVGTNISPVTSGDEIENSAPVADVGGPYIGFEGTPVTLDASGTYDPDGDDLIYNWDLNGDGIMEFRSWFQTPYLEWTWYDDYHGNITVFVKDAYDLEDSNTTTVDIYNIPPTITFVDGFPDEPLPIGETVELYADFIDPGLLDTHIATIDWGDGTITDGMIIDYVVTSSHTYEEPGYYILIINVTDDDGGSDVVIFTYVQIFDPDEPEGIDVFFDIKPGLCPNPIQLNENGVTPVAICGTEDFEIIEIDPSTLLIGREGYGEIAPIDWNYDDVATPFIDECEECNCEDKFNCHDLGSDGILDLVLNCNTLEIIEFLLYDTEDEDVLCLYVTGITFDEIPIYGEDVIWILNPNDITPPDIILSEEPIILWPPNHKYHTIEITDFIISVSDNSDPNLNMKICRILRRNR